MLHFQDAKDFAICNWYNIFKHLALKTIVIELPEALVAKFAAGDSDVDIEAVCSQEFVENVKNALNELDNNAFVKSDWHAPIDAKMFSIGNELKVSNMNDLILYLSTSNIISEDFSALQPGVPAHIVLKPWKSIHPATEFRCIVINNILRGISPRDWPTYYAHFKDEGPLIVETLRNFFEENVVIRFPRVHYTFDVIISFPDSPILLDFGPVNNKTNLFAFSWNEIAPLLSKEPAEDVAPVFRYLTEDLKIMSKADAIYKFANALS